MFMLYSVCGGFFVRETRDTDRTGLSLCRVFWIAPRPMRVSMSSVGISGLVWKWPIIIENNWPTQAAYRCVVSEWV